MIRARLTWLSPASLRVLAVGSALVIGACASEGTTASFNQGWRYPWDSPPVTAESGMVVSTDVYASEIGVEVMRAGGNAVDAAIAVSLALAVVNPEAGNIGGGGFMIVRMADGTTAALDYREKAPLAATRDMFLDENGNLTDKSVVGQLAAGQIRVVRSIPRLSVQSPLGCEALGAHTRRSVEGVHFDTGIVRHRGQAADFPKVRRFRYGILLEGCVGLQVLLGGGIDHSGLIQVEDTEVEHGVQDLPDLGHLVGTARRHKQIHHG